MRTHFDSITRRYTFLLDEQMNNLQDTLPGPLPQSMNILS